MIDPRASFVIGPELEAILWSMVDYGAMCGNTRQISPSDAQVSANMPSPSFLNFDASFTPRGSFDLSGAETLADALQSVSSYSLG